MTCLECVVIHRAPVGAAADQFDPVLPGPRLRQLVHGLQAEPMLAARDTETDRVVGVVAEEVHCAVEASRRRASKLPYDRRSYYKAVTRLLDGYSNKAVTRPTPNP